ARLPWLATPMGTERPLGVFAALVACPPPPPQAARLTAASGTAAATARKVMGLVRVMPLLWIGCRGTSRVPGAAPFVVGRAAALRPAAGAAARACDYSPGRPRSRGRRLVSACDRREGTGAHRVGRAPHAHGGWGAGHARAVGYPARHR